jgi:hypothetical protein
MTRKIVFLLLPLAMWAAGASTSAAHDFSGFVSGEVRLFADDSLYEGQERHNASVALGPEYYHEWSGGSSVTLSLFGRLDSADSSRTHFDVREANGLWLGEGWELHLGIGKVFWGVTEFLHLVDIVNQTDLVEDVDGEEKLGQPMAHLSLPSEWGVLDLFLLPGFRERTFPGREGRLRSSPAVETADAVYENSDEERHVDYALRYSHSIAAWDFGLSWFAGTGREPTLEPAADDDGEAVLVPIYEQISQAGLDAQVVLGNWLLKVEALYRTGQGEDFAAAVGGFEYALVNIATTGMDLGLLGEYAWDEREGEATNPFQNDLMFGLRWALNDAAGTELLFGFMQDLKSSSRSVSVEGSRRLGERWVLSVEGRAFSGASEGDVLYSIRADDFLRTEVTRYF